MFKVLIACFDNWDTISEIPYLLKAAGCSVDVFCGELSWLLRTDYIDNRFDSGEADADYLNRLIDHVKNNLYQWVTGYFNTRIYLRRSDLRRSIVL